MGELVVFSDVLCPWATVVVLRLNAARARTGADDELALVHRALPLELLLECTVVLPDATMLCNPSTRTGWVGGRMPRGAPVLVADDPSVYDRIVAGSLA